MGIAIKKKDSSINDNNNTIGVLVSIGTENGGIEFWTGTGNLQENNNVYSSSSPAFSFSTWKSVGVLPKNFCHVRSVKSIEWRQSHEDSSIIVLNRKRDENMNRKMVLEYASSGEDHLVRINRVAVEL